ncbi:hypothetical protein EYF80_035833 [Liparis tanakae]|uniref:Uncharacterized protein n=1 Tax=Liparis tanakae TaxID=230148 RepID=A0A4Z2GL15_9TELE|nr:hypothetical protein EYF80_035833 [Liparis tanakae]
MKGTREGPGCAPPGGRPSPSRFWTSVLMQRKKVLLYPLVLRTLKRILVAVCTSSVLVQIPDPSISAAVQLMPVSLGSHMLPRHVLV